MAAYHQKGMFAMDDGSNQDSDSIIHTERERPARTLAVDFYKNRRRECSQQDYSQQYPAMRGDPSFIDLIRTLALAGTPDSAEIEASERFEKSALVKAHELHRLSSFKLVADTTFTRLVQRSVVEASAANVDSVPLRNLNPILISHLHVGRHHSGRVLHGRLCVEPFTVVAVQTIIEDTAGGAAKLSIYNALPTSASLLQEARTMFRKGMMVAIKTPFLKRAKDGCLMIRVDNPASSVEQQSYGADHNPMHLESPKIQSHDQTVVSASRQLRHRGNKAFEARDWKLSTQLYTDALLLLLRHENDTCSDRFKPTISQELVLAFSNRAEARLRLQHFERAERDVCKALHLDPAHIKSLYRRGRALHGMYLYQEAALSFKKALDLINKQKSSSNYSHTVVMRQEIAEALKLSQICHNQASTGEYNFAQICEDEQQGQEPICAEYIGPVMVGRAMEKTLGRGLLVTKDVKRGDLLLVTKAVAQSGTQAAGRNYVSIHEQVNIPDAATTGSQSTLITSGYDEDIAIQLVQLAMASPRFKDQLYSLASDIALDVNVDDLHIPDMALFKPCKPSCTTKDEITIDEEIPGEVSGIDVDRIRGIARENSFEVPGHIGVTMWLLASFINHSCIPTACWVRVKDRTLFVRAACDLRRGQEITICYSTNKLATVPYSLRASICMKSRGFECRCERCVFEKSVLPFTMTLEENFLVALKIPGMAKETVDSLEWVLRNCDAIIKEEKQKQWWRASFTTAYLRMLGNYEIEEETAVFFVTTILTAVHGTVGAVEEMIFTQLPIRRLSVHGRMCECLYGKQSPSALQRILAARSKLLATLPTKH